MLDIYIYIYIFFFFLGVYKNMQMLDAMDVENKMLGKVRGLTWWLGT